MAPTSKSKPALKKIAEATGVRKMSSRSKAPSKGPRSAKPKAKTQTSPKKALGSRNGRKTTACEIAKREKSAGGETEEPEMSQETQIQGFAHPPGCSLIEALPTEILHMIARESTFGTVARLSRASKTLNGILNDKRKQLWCKLLAPMFDDGDPAPSLANFKRQSQLYRIITTGDTWQEPGAYRSWARSKVSCALRLLIKEAYKNGGKESPNITTLAVAARNLGLFQQLYVRKHGRPHNVPANANYLGPILLTMLHIGFDVWSTNLSPNNRAFDGEFKAAAYQHTSIYPLFIKKEQADPRIGLSTQMRPHAINLLLIANYFRSFLLDTHNHPLAHQFSGLPPHLRPQPWRHQIDSNESTPSGTTYWKGCSAYVDMHSIRRWRLLSHGNPDDPQWLMESDCFDEDELARRQFFDLRLDFLEDSQTRLWPQDFNDHAPLCPEEVATSPDHVNIDQWFQTSKTQFNAPFVGLLLGRDEEIVTGNMHELMGTGGNTGFKRVSFITTKTSAVTLDEPKDDLLHEVNQMTTIQAHTYVYEGVLMPGGNMIVGRWWQAEDFRPDTFVRVDSASKTPPEVPPTMDEMRRRPDYDERKRWSGCFQHCTGPFIYWKVERQ